MMIFRDTKETRRQILKNILPLGKIKQFNNKVGNLKLEILLRYMQIKEFLQI